MAALVKARTGKRAVRRAGDGGRLVDFLAFVLAGETYAVPIADVAEILRPPPITVVPRSPPNVLGVISVRGKLVTVVDLRRRFHLPEAPPDRRNRVLLSEAPSGELIGLLVDEVRDVWRLAAPEIEPATVLGGEQAAHITGIGRPAGSPGAVLILIDLRPILASGP